MNKLKELRDRTGLSQSEFSKAFDIPVRTLQQWEQNKSAPPPYVLKMLENAIANYRTTQEDTQRHFIPAKTSWRVCIPEPFKNCERIYPIQQRKVRALIDDIVERTNPDSIWIFGSSTTEKCHMGSDVDIYVEADQDTNLIGHVHDFEYDLWTSRTADDRLKKEIRTKGVKVYG